MLHRAPEPVRVPRRWVGSLKAFSGNKAWQDLAYWCNNRVGWGRLQCFLFIFSVSISLPKVEKNCI